MSSLVVDGKQRFTHRASEYATGRPTYPGGVLDRLKTLIGFDASWQVADIGAGTGLASRLFLENGNAVTCVEPNAAMRAFAESQLGKFDRLRILDGSAEQTGLEASSIDLVVAAQAFHWFDTRAFALECLRVLTDRGQVMLIRNNKPTDSSSFASDYEAFERAHAIDRHVVIDKQTLSEQTIPNWFDPATLVSFTLPNHQPCDFDTLLSRVVSFSSMPTRGHERFEAMVQDLRALFDRYQQSGQITITYQTCAYVGRPSEAK
jgi:SAM-dependent methyltransferase